MAYSSSENFMRELCTLDWPHQQMYMEATVPKWKRINEQYLCPIDVQVFPVRVCFFYTFSEKRVEFRKSLMWLKLDQHSGLRCHVVFCGSQHLNSHGLKPHCLIMLMRRNVAKKRQWMSKSVIGSFQSCHTLWQIMSAAGALRANKELLCWFKVLVQLAQHFQIHWKKMHASASHIITPWKEGENIEQLARFTLHDSHKNGSLLAPCLGKSAS